MHTTEHSDTAARGRRVMQHAAVLLYAARPLDQYLKRLARVLRRTLSAQAFVVWLMQPNGELRLRFGSPDDESQSQAAQRCAQSARSLLVQEGERSEIYAPVMSGSAVLGVAAVISNPGTRYTDDDVRLFEALTHYIAIALGNQALVQSIVSPWRRLRLFAIVLLCAAALATLAVIGFAVEHSRELTRAALANAQIHVSQVADRLEATANDAGQLSRSLAVLGSAVRGDRKRAELLLSKMLRSAPATTIYGAGLWYAPYAFDGRSRLFGPYVHRGKTAKRDIVLTYVWSSPRYDYPSRPWYRLAQNSGNKTSFTQPYFDVDLTYVTAAHPMYGERGQLIGVATVDMSLPFLQKFVRSQSSPSRVLYITARNNQTFVYPDARAPVTSLPVSKTQQYIARQFGGPRVDTTAKIGIVGWTVHESNKEAALHAGTRKLWTLTILALAALWLCTAVGIAAIAQSRNQVFERIRSELEHSRLRNEIEQRLAAEQRLVETSESDPLTGLPARVALLDAVDAALAEVRDRKTQFAVALIDLDRFGAVNEGLGHAKGDEVLRTVAERLVRACGNNCVVGRYGGDEFLAIVRITDPFEAMKLAERVLSLLGEAVDAGGDVVYVRASMGIVIPDQTYTAPQDVVRDADIAMYRAKSKGTLRFAIFDAEMREQAEQRVRLESQLRHAVTREDFFVEYQPIVRLSEKRIEGFEALVRWQPERDATMYPADFVESAERIGAIVPIDFKVLRAAREHIKKWRSPNGTPPFVSVNMSGLHFATRGLARELVRAVRELQFPKGALHLEITETALMRDRDVARDALAELRGEGVRVSIDDFGTGYSSLAYVEQFRVDALKIDKSFVETMAQHSQAAEIVRAISALGRALGLDVIAEGVESEQQVRMLREAGITHGQGFVFSAPVRAERASELLASGLALATK